MLSPLDRLSQHSRIDCDTLDAEVPSKLGPFVDCTSNQAIAHFELTKTAADGTLHHDSLIREAIQDAAGSLHSLQGDATLEAFAVELLMVKLQLLILPHVTGYVHLQTNPLLSYSCDGTVKCARRMVKIFQVLAPTADPKRVCIKIPASWEGMQACRILEKEGIATLATTMFCMEQAILAAEADCTYIAPYINELRVHFDAEYKDMSKAFAFCIEAQTSYRARGYRTKVLAASFTSAEEVARLSGIEHLTISPAILEHLAAGGDVESLTLQIEENAAKISSQSLSDHASGDVARLVETCRDESAWRLAFTRSGFGKASGKLVQAICYFSDFQDKLEALVQQVRQRM